MDRDALTRVGPTRILAGRWLGWTLLVAACGEPASSALDGPAAPDLELPPFSRPETEPPRRAPIEAEPAKLCGPQTVPALQGEAPPAYQVRLPECGQALPPIRVEGFERTRLLDSLDVGLVGVPVGERASVELAFSNESDRAQTFSASWVGPSPFELDAPTVVLQPGGATSWSLTWTPSSVGRLQADLEVRRGDETEVILVDGISVAAAELRCRIELPEEISREAALSTELVCQNPSSVPLDVQRLRLLAQDGADAFELRSRDDGGAALRVPPRGVARWPFELCPLGVGPVGFRAEVETRTPQGVGLSGSAEASGVVVGPRLEISEPAVLRPTPGSTQLPVDFQLRNTGLEPVDLRAVETPPELRWRRSMERRLPPDATVEAELTYVGTSSVPRTLQVELQTSVGDQILDVRVEPQALDAGTDCIDDLVGLPEDVDLGELGDWSFGLLSRNGIPERLGSFTLENRGPTRCRFGLRGRGDVQLELDLDLAPGERALIPLNVVIEPQDCFIQGTMELHDLDDWRPPRRFDVGAKLLRDGPRFRVVQAAAGPSCPWRPEWPLLWVRSRDEVNSLDLDGLSLANTDAGLALEPSDCERLNGAIEVQSPSGRRARVPIGLRPSSSCGDAVEFDPLLQVDDFEMLGRPEVDVVWVLDDTLSMGPLWPELMENFDAYVQFVDAQARDARIFIRFLQAGWVRDELGAPRAFDLSPGNGRVAFMEALGEPDFRGGHEPTLDVAVEATSSAPLRMDARLELIDVSNEGDQSSLAIDTAVSELLSIKGYRNTHLFSFNAISGGLDGCETEDGLVARPAPRLVEIANRTGGVEESICTKDWSRTLEEPSQRVFGFKSRLFLTKQPVIQTIEVRVDDVMMPGQEPSGEVNWTYDFSSNSVNFLPLSVPRPGSTIRIRYEVECL